MSVAMTCLKPALLIWKARTPQPVPTSIARSRAPLYFASQVPKSSRCDVRAGTYVPSNGWTR